MEIVVGFRKEVWIRRIVVKLVKIDNLLLNILADYGHTISPINKFPATTNLSSLWRILLAFHKSIIKLSQLCFTRGLYVHKFSMCTHFRWYDAPDCPNNHIAKSMKSKEEHCEISHPHMISDGMLKRYIDKAKENRSPCNWEKQKSQAS